MPHRVCRRGWRRIVVDHRSQVRDGIRWTNEISPHQRGVYGACMTGKCGAHSRGRRREHCRGWLQSTSLTQSARSPESARAWEMMTKRLQNRIRSRAIKEAKNVERRPPSPSPSLSCSRDGFDVKGLPEGVLNTFNIIYSIR